MRREWPNFAAIALYICETRRTPGGKLGRLPCGVRGSALLTGPGRGREGALLCPPSDRPSRCRRPRGCKAGGDKSRAAKTAERKKRIERLRPIPSLKPPMS